MKYDTQYVHRNNSHFTQKNISINISLILLKGNEPSYSKFSSELDRKLNSNHILCRPIMCSTFCFRFYIQLYAVPPITPIAIFVIIQLNLHIQ